MAESVSQEFGDSRLPRPLGQDGLAESSTGALPVQHTLLVGRRVGMFHLVCYLRDGDRVFETYWTNGRGVEAMDNSYGLMDLTVYGRQEVWEDSPAGWPQRWAVNRQIWRTDGRPIAQWSRLHAGRSDDLGSEGHDRTA